MKPEQVAALIITESIRKRINLRAASYLFFKKNAKLSFLKPVIRVLTLGVARNYRLLDYILDLCGVNVRKLPLVKLNLARVLVYEYFFQGVRKPRVRRMLSMFSRDLAESLQKLELDSLKKDLRRRKAFDVLYSVPKWLYLKAIEAKVPDIEAFLARLQHDPTRWARVSTHLVPVTELCKRLGEKGVLVEPDADLDDCVKLKCSVASLKKTEEYASGMLFLQDKASILAVHVLGGVSGKKVIDITGGPGGKITHAAQRGAYFALVCELSLKRCFDAVGVAKRLEVAHIVDVICCDSLKSPVKLKDFNIVIVDPPCSNLGRLCYEPEVRMWIQEDDVHKLARFQAKLLKEVAEKVKSEQVVLYTTCTWTLDECEKVVKEGLEMGLELVDQSPFIGIRSPFIEKCQRLYPHMHETQGFFIALLQKG